MKFRKFSAACLALTAATALAACSSDDEQDDTAATNTEAQESASSDGDSAAPALPSPADLNAILAKATDPNASEQEKTATVQGGETAPEIFDTMAQSKQESGAEFEVVDPVLPGYDPQSVLTTVNFTTADGQQQTADRWSSCMKMAPGSSPRRGLARSSKTPCRRNRFRRCVQIPAPVPPHPPRRRPRATLLRLKATPRLPAPSRRQLRPLWKPRPSN